MWKPVWGRVLVLPEDVEETDPVLKRAKEAGIDLSGTELAKEQGAQIKARVISIGGDAFDGWKGRVPEEGDTILFDRHHGFIEEVDGVKYRIISDTDIVCIWSEENG